MVDFFAKNVDFVRILLTLHTVFVDFVLVWLTCFFSRLPHALLEAMLAVCLRGCLHADAGMRSAVVIEGDEGGDALTCVADALEAMLAIDDLGLEDAVHTLCDGVVRGLVVFRHGDADGVLLEFVRIGIAAVLYASV